MSRPLSLLPVAALAAVLLSVPATAAQAGSSGGICQDPRAIVTKKTTSGSKVWIPSSRSAGPFQFGGSQSISYADGELNAKTTGSADTVGGSGGVNIGVAQASATYDHQWSRSTTRTTSFSRTFTTNSPTMPRDVNWRWRLYTSGYRFVITKTCRIPTPYVDARERFVKRKIIVPRTGSAYTFHVEKYSQRNWLLNLRGEPIRR